MSVETLLTDNATRIAIGDATALAFGEELVDASEAADVRGIDAVLAGVGLDSVPISFSVDAIRIDPAEGPDTSHAPIGTVVKAAGNGFDSIGSPEFPDLATAIRTIAGLQLSDLFAPADLDRFVPADEATATPALALPQLDTAQLGEPSIPAQSESGLQPLNLTAILAEIGATSLSYDGCPALPMGEMGLLPETQQIAREFYWWY